MPSGISANLDFLRAVAVLLVLTQHLSQRMHVGFIGWIPTTSLGLFGVLLFFVHTSLVLTYSMERSGLQGGPLLKDFYIRRIFRIYPLSLLAVTAALALHLESDVNGTPGLSFAASPGGKAILSQLLLVQNLVHVKSIVNVLWSLPFELQMYLFLPFLYFWVRRNGAFRHMMGLWFVCLLGAWAQPHFAFLDRASLLRFAPCFVPGVIAFVLPRTARIPSIVWPVFVIALIVTFTVKPVLAVGWMLCLVLGILIPSFREIQTKSLRFIANGIATYSYGIYISHQFCIWFAFVVLAGHSVWLRVVVLVSSLLVAPVLLYHGLEKPMIRAGVRLAARGREKTPVALPAAA